MVTLTLEGMAGGGMYDQIGGGFHRYSTDAHWLVPHFEKMLYDNALLAMAYLEAYQVTGRADFARVVREILRYVERDMTSPQGAFYSATDADSLTPAGRSEEGYFFTWTLSELEAALGAERARVVAACYDVTPSGNFEGRSILHTPRTVDEVAQQLQLPPETVRRTVEEAKDVLYAARARRPAPLRDDKVLAAWNGLMISAYAQAALVLGDERYAAIAARAADFVLTAMRKDGRLLRHRRLGPMRNHCSLSCAGPSCPTACSSSRVPASRWPARPRSCRCSMARPPAVAGPPPTSASAGSARCRPRSPRSSPSNCARWTRWPGTPVADQVDKAANDCTPAIAAHLSAAGAATTGTVP